MPVEFSQRIAPVRSLGLLWRSLILATILASGLVAFAMGAGTSEHPDMGSADFLTSIYYTIGLFVLAGIDLGTPTGGPEVARALLWFTYFAAPAVTTLSVIEGILRTIAPERWHLRRLRNHVVLAGAGRIARLYLRRLRERHPHKPVLIVEIQADHPAMAALRQQAHLLTGDIKSNTVLDALRLEHADQVVLLTGDDFANLDAAANILARVPSLSQRMVAHVANLHFMRLVCDTHVAQACTFFNSHDIAATHLVRTELLEHFRRTAFRDMVVLAGFGRFGQSVLDNLQRRAPDKFGCVIIIDLEAGKRQAVFEQQVGFEDFYERRVVDGDLRDPRTWQHIELPNECEPVFIIGSGDDGTNLRTALWVKSAFPKAYVVARTFNRSPFADEVAREGGFLVFSVADLVLQSMPETWFEGE